MTQAAIILFELIKKTLRQEKMSVMLSEELYQLAKENGVSGMIYQTIIPIESSSPILGKFKHDYYEFVQWDTVQTKTISEINELFSKTYIDHIFLKGSYLKKIYPESYMRSMGDIDILVKPDKMRLIHQILDEAGYVNWANSTGHDCFRKGHKIFLEIHPSLDNEFDLKYSPLFENTWDETNPVSSFEYQFKDAFLLAYLLYHMIKHLSSSGIGIRNVLDIGLFLKQVDSRLTVEEAYGLLEPTHLWTFFQNIGYLTTILFDFEYQTDYLSGYIPDEAFTEDITKFILKSGVHGHGEFHNPYLSGISKQALEEDNISSSKFKYILRLFFPPYRLLKGTYHYLEKYPILLPIAWIERAFKLVFKRRKSTFKKLKRLKIKEAEIQDVEALYSKLGL